MNCATHAEKQASGACTRCGRLFCAECLVVVTGRYMCRACVSYAFEEQQRQQTAAVAPPPIIVNNNNNNNNNIAATQIVAPHPVYLRKSPGLAALLSFFIPGLGQLYCGRIGRGILFFVGTAALTPVFIGIGIWIWNIIDAYNVAQRYPAP